MEHLKEIVFNSHKCAQEMREKVKEDLTEYMNSFHVDDNEEVPSWRHGLLQDYESVPLWKQGNYH